TWIASLTGSTAASAPCATGTRARSSASAPRWRSWPRACRCRARGCSRRRRPRRSGTASPRLQDAGRAELAADRTHGLLLGVDHHVELLRALCDLADLDRRCGRAVVLRAADTESHVEERDRDRRVLRLPI